MQSDKQFLCEVQWRALQHWQPRPEVTGRGPRVNAALWQLAWDIAATLDAHGIALSKTHGDYSTYSKVLSVAREYCGEGGHEHYKIIRWTVDVMSNLKGRHPGASIVPHWSPGSHAGLSCSLEGPHILIRTENPDQTFLPDSLPIPSKAWRKIKQPMRNCVTVLLPNYARTHSK
jgi:hypothetical protein